MLHGQRFQIALVRPDPGNIHLQLAHAPAEQQVRETVLELRHHDEHLRPRGHVVDRPRHGEALGNRREFLLQRGDLQCFIASHAVEYAAHEKTLAEVVVEDSEFIDITLVPVEEADHGGDLSRGARTCDRQHELMRKGVNDDIAGHAVLHYANGSAAKAARIHRSRTNYTGWRLEAKRRDAGIGASGGSGGFRLRRHTQRAAIRETHTRPWFERAAYSKDIRRPL